MEKRDNSGTGAMRTMRRTVNISLFSLRLAQMRRIAKVDTQKIRTHLINQLQKIFDIAAKEAKHDQAWARIAAYTAQIIETLSKGYDEKQTDEDLAKLEEMLKEVQAKQAEREQGETGGGKPDAA